MCVDNVDVARANQLQEFQRREVVDLGRRHIIGSGQTDDVNSGARELITDLAALLQVAHRDVEPTAIHRLRQMAHDRLSTANPQR